MLEEVDHVRKLLLNRRAFLSTSAVAAVGLTVAPQQSTPSAQDLADNFASAAIGTVRWSQLTIPLQDAKTMHEMLLNGLTSLLCFTGDALPESASYIGSFPSSAAEATHQEIGFVAQLSYPSGHTVVLAATRGLSQQGEVIIRGDKDTRRIFGTSSWGRLWQGSRVPVHSMQSAREYSHVALVLAARASGRGATLPLGTEVG